MKELAIRDLQNSTGSKLNVPMFGERWQYGAGVAIALMAIVSVPSFAQIQLKPGDTA
jgi:hypothetical protein